MHVAGVPAPDTIVQNSPQGLTLTKAGGTTGCMRAGDFGGHTALGWKPSPLTHCGSLHPTVNSSVVGPCL